MAVRQIRLFGDPVLKTPSDLIVEFDETLFALVEDLLDTTSVAGRAGVAAPQIGVNLRAFSFHVDKQLGYVLNPTLAEVSGELRLVEEGCLSVPGLWHKTPRYEWARVTGFDKNGDAVEVQGSGLLAQALQHECDHLDGMLYLDRLDAEERKLAMREVRNSDWFLKN
jgi:peptide deformylase